LTWELVYAIIAILEGLSHLLTLFLWVAQKHSGINILCHEEKTNAHTCTHIFTAFLDAETVYSKSRQHIPTEAIVHWDLTHYDSN